MNLRALRAILLVGMSAACGGGQKGADAPGPSAEESTPKSDVPEADTSAEGAEEGPASGPWDIPRECHGEGQSCTPNPKWVKKLCQDVYPGVALFLFSKSSPFTHGYLSRKTKAVNASGGPTSGDEWLAFDEEVILLLHREADLGGMQVSGAGGGYDAMRLDGSCVTLGSEEVRLEKPPAPKYATVPWRFIGDDMQEALRKNEKINTLYRERRQECKGAFSGEVSKLCVTKDEQLNRAIIDAVTSGSVEVPQPEFRP